MEKFNATKEELPSEREAGGISLTIEERIAVGKMPAGYQRLLKKRNVGKRSRRDAMNERNESENRSNWNNGPFKEDDKELS